MNKELPPYAISAEKVVDQLRSDISKGLTQREGKDRLIKYGPNSLPEPKQTSLISIFIHQFLSPLIYLLLAAAGIAFFAGEVKDAVVILIVVLINAIIGSIQEGRAEQSIADLRRLSKLKARVFRDGGEIIIEASKLVPGDILILGSGDAIPADSRILEASSVFTAEAALTGESVPTSKSVEVVEIETVLADRKNMVYAGTYITSGRARAIVVTTGISSEIGKIATLATTTIQPKTQLELRIEQFGRYLVIAALIMFVLVIGLGLFRGILFSEIFMIAISQMVSLVPEGLPVAMTIALAVGVQRMARRGTIVRRLSAVETLGSTTVICSDKTGTLTKNEMTVTSVYLPIANKEISVSGVGYKPEGDFFEDGKSIQPNILRKFFEICCLCNDAQILQPNSSNSPWKILGDPTEGALLTFAAKGGLDPSLIREEFSRVSEIPFNSDIKMMATQHEINGKHTIFIKGSPEAILDFSTLVYHDDNIIALDDKSRTLAQEAAKKMADSALRVLALGFIENQTIDESKGFLPLAGKVVFVGLVGELDPPRDEVASSILDCLSAGVRPVMVTGDRKATGIAIAKTLGISKKNDLAVDGRELEKWSDKELSDNIDKIRVFARVHPEQKLRIVKAYQEKGEIVAMTGDGVNDAPALVRANVGVAMGITGSEVAKEAAKIVITDDNFTTIVKAISEGRLVYQNIKKLILFLFVTSIDEVAVLFFALLFGYPIPLAAVQILWINLVTEGVLTINLIMEPPEGNEMKRPPIPVDEPLLDRALLSRIPLMASASVISTFGWFIYRNSLGIPYTLLQTETFTVLAVCQWFNVLNCRSATQTALTWNLIKNPWLLGGLILGNILHLLVVYWPPLGGFFHTVPIGKMEFFQLGIVASLVLWVEEIRKFILRRRKGE